MEQTTIVSSDASSAGHAKTTDIRSNAVQDALEHNPYDNGTTARAEASDVQRTAATPPEQALGDSPQASLGDGFLTQHGGFFYLLNLLRLSTAQQLLEDSPCSAWQHLYLLCRLLDRPLDVELQTFLAQQLQLDDIATLARLQPGDTEQALFRLAEQRFAHQLFWPDALLNRRARVHHDATHIDIDLHQHSVDLQIRLCGLDVDPGWLPWLGRVVRFHYLDDPLLLDPPAPESGEPAT